jgi:hypothetical protein
MSKKLCKEDDLVEKVKEKKKKYVCKECDLKSLKEKWVCKPREIKR